MFTCSKCEKEVEYINERGLCSDCAKKEEQRKKLIWIGIGFLMIFGWGLRKCVPLDQKRPQSSISTCRGSNVDSCQTKKEDTFPIELNKGTINEERYIPNP